MEKNSVPQDPSPTYEGQRKLLYAVDDKGQYTGVQSAGWEAETFATLTAVAELDRLREEAWTRALAGDREGIDVAAVTKKRDAARALIK